MENEYFYGNLRHILVTQIVELTVIKPTFFYYTCMTSRRIRVK